jgi:hypothetical protein
MKRNAALALAILALWCGGAASQTIGVFFDPQATQCSGTIPPSSLATLYVLALPGGAVAEGFIGAAFRIDGAPAAWFWTPVYQPGVCLPCWNPLHNDAFFVFPTCRTTAVAHLMTLTVFATTSIQDVVLVTRANDVPHGDHPDCPVFVLCDEPVYTGICANGYRAVINPVQESCTVGVAPATWSRVKSLYGG